MANISSLKPFKPGPDPRRNTKGSLGKATLIKRELTELLTEALFQQTSSGKTRAKLIVERLIYEAINGDIRAMKLIFKYVDGNVSSQEKYSQNKLRELTQEEKDELDKLLATKD